MVAAILPRLTEMSEIHAFRRAKAGIHMIHDRESDPRAGPEAGIRPLYWFSAKSVFIVKNK